MNRRGRPTAADLRQRAAKKAAWAAWTARIERGAPVTWREALDHLGPLRAELFMRTMNSPALQFVFDKVEDGSTIGQAFEDLVLSGIPLDSLDDEVRRVIVGMMRSRGPIPKRASDRSKFRVIKEALALAEQRGEPATINLDLGLAPPAPPPRSSVPSRLKEFWAELFRKHHCRSRKFHPFGFAQ